jgi:hypothetical protein
LNIKKPDANSIFPTCWSSGTTRITMISERTEAALKAAKARGVRLGGHGAEVLAPQHRQEAHQRAMELEPVITELKPRACR